MEANVLQTLWRYTHLYMVIMAQHIKVSLSYRADFILGTVANLLGDFAMIATFLLIFDTIPNIAGWTFPEMLFLYWFYKAATNLHVMIFGVTNMWWLGVDIQQGDFMMYYTRPVNMLFSFLLSRSDFSLPGMVTTIVITTAGMAYSVIQLGLVWTPFQWLFLPVSIFTSALAIAAIIIAAASTAFWTAESGALLNLFFRMRDFSQYPLSIFDRSFRILFTYLIPIGFIAFYPAQLFLRPQEASILSYLSPLISVGMFALAYQVWRRGVNGYTGTGS